MTTNEYVKLIRPAKSSFLIVQYTLKMKLIYQVKGAVKS